MRRRERATQPPAASVTAVRPMAEGSGRGGRRRTDEAVTRHHSRVAAAAPAQRRPCTDTGCRRVRHPAAPGPAPVTSTIVSPVRRCSRTACSRPAIATLTYVYADSTAVLGPLAMYAEPHCYDLCAEHSERLTAPRGWEVVRLAPDPDALGPSSDDLEALADAVREAARPAQPTPRPGPVEVGRRGHLRVLRSPE